MSQNKTVPLVAIECLVYNHEKFLRDCLEGFVMQQTNFPFVAIVHDDASTDSSAAIIHEYEELYPDIIRPIYETENQYSKHDGSLHHIVRDALFDTGAKYIACCEGDDYWTDPNKLQTQVDFMESHPDYTLCFHKAYIKHQTPDGNYIDYEHHVTERDYDAVEIISSAIVATCSTLFLASVYKSYIKDPRYIIGDAPLWEHCASKGKMHCFGKEMACYRMLQSGWTMSNSIKEVRNMVWLTQRYHYYSAMYENYPVLTKKYRKTSANFCIACVKESLRHDKKSTFFWIKEGFSRYGLRFPIYTIEFLIRAIIGKITSSSR